jgi:hypothetical protein
MVLFNAYSYVYIVTWMTRALLSNGSINKSQQQIVFYGVRAATVAMQWFSKHVSTIEAVFPWKGVILKASGATVQF